MIDLTRKQDDIKKLHVNKTISKNWRDIKEMFGALSEVIKLKILVLCKSIFIFYLNSHKL